MHEFRPTSVSREHLINKDVPGKCFCRKRHCNEDKIGLSVFRLIARESFLDVLGRYLNFHAGSLVDKLHWGTRIKVSPTSVQGFRVVGISSLGLFQGNAEFPRQVQSECEILVGESK